MIMEQEKKQIEVCNHSLNLARQHRASGNYVRAFAHYLIHKNVLWELKETENRPSETANVTEIYFTFEKVNIHFDRKLKISHDEEILLQWKAMNEQFIDFMKKLLKELTIGNEENREKEEYDDVKELLVKHSTDHAINLFKIGRYLDACDIFDGLLSHPLLTQDPTLLIVQEQQHRISNEAAARWHFTMLNDQARNENFKLALEEVFKSFEKNSVHKLLDIGTGSGLLSMYARDAARKTNVDASIIACEASVPMAEIAKKIINKNKNVKVTNSAGIENIGEHKTIQLIQKLSTHISQKEVENESIDVLVTETFDAGLLGEHVLETLDHAFKNLLSKKFSIIPCRASVYIAPIHSRAVIAKTRVINNNIGPISLDGIDIISNELDEEPYTSERLDTLPGGFRFLSNDCGEKLIDINFENANQVHEYLYNGRTFQRRIQCRLKKEETNSELHAIALWFELHLIDKNKYGKDLIINTSPTNKTKNRIKGCWEQAVFPLLPPLLVNNGDEIEIKMDLKGHFSLHSCDKIRPKGADKSTVNETTLKLPSSTVSQLNDQRLQGLYQKVAESIASSSINHEQGSSKKVLDILDLTETCILSLQLLKLNPLNNLTIAHFGASSLQEDISTSRFAMKIQYVCELALKNELKVDNIDCVTSIDRAEDRSYDVVFIDIVESCGKLNREYLEKIPVLRNKLRLSNPDSTLMPSKITIYCQLLQSNTINQMAYLDDKNVHGYDVSSTFNKLSVNHLQDIDIPQLFGNSNKECDISVEHGDEKKLSDPVDIYNLDLMTLSTSHTAKKELEFSITESGTVHGIAYWFKEEYKGNVAVSNYNCEEASLSDEEKLSCRKQAIVALKSPIQVKNEEKLKFIFLFSNGLIDFVQASDK